MLRGCSFAIECDHNNLCLDKLALCLTPIVVRWRLYLQGFSFTIRHIPGKQNYLGDFLSKMYGSTLDPLPLEVPMAIERCAPINEEPDPEVLQPPYSECSPASLFAAVHGGRSLHQGLKLTWNSLNQHFAGHTVSYAQLKELMETCPLCQKARYGPILELSHPPTIRTLTSNSQRARDKLYKASQCY